MEVKRKGDLLSNEKRNSVLNDLVSFFKDERNEDIGLVAAGEILDFFLENVGLDLYNYGVDDSRKFLKSKMEDLELDMEVLLKK